MRTDQTLSGVRVLDLTRTLAGPFGAMILGELGAEVIKVEQPEGGDDSRRLPPHWNGESAAFLAMNRNKKSVAIDLKSETGRDRIFKLVKTSDVVLESFRPGVMEKLGIGFDVLKGHNPDLIYCSISAFGRGPLGRSMPGYDPLLQAFSGIMKATGHPGMPPTRLAPSAIDLNSGMWCAIQVMAALARRAREPGPQRLEVALLDTALNLMGHQITAYLANGEIPVPQGSGSPIAAPYEVFAAKDGDILIAAGNDRLFRSLCDEMERSELLDDARYASMAGRVRHREVLHETLQATLKSATVSEWLERFARAGVPAGPVQDISQALQHPVVAERRLLMSCREQPRNPDLKLLRLPLGDDIVAFREPPLLGEHTEEVLRSLEQP